MTNMKTYRKLVFCLLFGGFLAFLPMAHASADNSRYFVKSTKGFWKNALGVRHNFDNGFTTDASDFQLRLAKVFGVEIEPVAILQILPGEPTVTSDTDSDSKISPAFSSDDSDIVSPKISAPKSIKGKGGTIRYLPSDQTPWGIETIYANSAIETTSGGLGINVAILDTGILVSHPDLARRITQCKDFSNFRYPVVDGKCDDKNGHGTHVAGIIAADAGADGKGLYGVAPQANLFAYKVCGTNGSCYADDIATALRMAADEGAKVVNMSFGSDQESSLIRDAVDYAFSKGSLLVAAAGNDGPFPDSIDYPAAYASVVAVGAINQTKSVTDWSSRGINSTTTPWIVENRDVELATPGEYIESTWNNKGYAILSGTSMASPFVVGLAAKYWQSSASASISDQLLATRDYLHFLANDLLPLGDDDASGFGLPQVK
ncbi:MAG: S8 family serine peptidase [Candidatus Yanofskybacteria bacterium]|nr:S8 family serine peptidase [Candidatus Yanofskybacteria bacterium]